MEMKESDRPSAGPLRFSYRKCSGVSLRLVSLAMESESES